MTWRAKRRRARSNASRMRRASSSIGLKLGLAPDEHHRIQEGIGDAVMRLNLVGAEADRERVVTTIACARNRPTLAHAAKIASRLRAHRPRGRFTLAASFAGRDRAHSDVGTAVG